MLKSLKFHYSCALRSWGLGICLDRYVDFPTVLSVYIGPLYAEVVFGDINKRGA